MVFTEKYYVRIVVRCPGNNNEWRWCVVWKCSQLFLTKFATTITSYCRIQSESFLQNGCNFVSENFGTGSNWRIERWLALRFWTLTDRALIGRTGTEPGIFPAPSRKWQILAGTWVLTGFFITCLCIFLFKNSVDNDLLTEAGTYFFVEKNI